MNRILLLIGAIVFAQLPSMAQLQTVTTTGNTTTNVIRFTGEGGIGVSGAPELVLGYLSTPRTNDTRTFIGWKGDAATNTTTNGQAGTLLLQGRTNLADMSIDFATGLTTAALRMRIAGNGNVSIGDNSLVPASRLLIKGSGATNATTSLLIQNSATTELLRVLDNGNVGINMSAPADKLHVQNGNVIVASTSGLGTSMGSIRFSNASWLNAYAGIAGQLNLAGADQVDLVFYTAYGNALEKMRLMSNSGFLGLGTATPAAKLDIVGSGGVTVDFQMTGRQRIKSISPGVWFNDLTGDQAELGTIGSGNPNQALGIYTNTGGWNSFNVMKDGSVSIGAQATNANAKLDVTGNIYCSSKIFIGAPDAATATQIAPFALSVRGDAVFNRVKVRAYGNWPDYVFEEKYNLLPLKEVEAYIEKNKHLPGIASAEEVKKEGIDLGDNQALLLQKVEELTLYIIQQDKKIDALQKKVDSLNK